jgi:fatty-acid desaturase
MQAKLLKARQIKIDGPILLFLGTIHLGAIPLVWLYPSLAGVLTMFGLYVLTGLGITVGYHRRFSHSAFQSARWFDYVLAVLGLLAGEGPPIFWVAHHRKHHKYSDHEQDPHSPKAGFWWAHFLWIFPKKDRNQLGLLYLKYGKDMLQDPFYKFLENSYLFWHLGFALCLFLVGYAFGGTYLGMSLLAYGFFARMLIVLHITWMVNSVCHCWGYRNYETTDTSRNNWLVGILAHGEGWHNNHHHVSAAVNHGQRPWEVDLSFYVIMALALIGSAFCRLGFSSWQFVHSLKYYPYKTQKYAYLFPKTD